MARHRQWHISGWGAYLIAPIAVPIILLIEAGQWFGLLKTTADMDASDVESYLEDAIAGRGGEWDWDDFICIRITEPTLDQIRREASSIDWPLNGEGRKRLLELLERVRALKQAASLRA